MNNDMAGKIEKAKVYAEQRERFTFDQFQLRFQGNNNDHHLTYAEGQWQCDCEFFLLRGVCSHTMAVERLLVNML